LRPLEGKCQLGRCAIQYRLGVINHEHSATLKVKHLRRLSLPVQSSPLCHQVGLTFYLFFPEADQVLLAPGAQGALGKDPVLDISTLVLMPGLFLETNLCSMPVCPCSLGCRLNGLILDRNCSRGAICNMLPTAPQPCRSGLNALRTPAAPHQPLLALARAWGPKDRGPDQPGCHEQVAVSIWRGSAGELQHQPALLSQLTALPMLPK